MLTKEQMSSTLKSLGIKKAFKPVFPADEAGNFDLETNRPVRIVKGWLHGVSILWSASHGMFNVWTDQKKKAKVYAGIHKLKVSLLDGEAELWVPPSLADEVLPKFGAKIKQERSPAQIEAQKKALERARIARGSPPVDPRKGTSSPEQG